MPKHLKIAFGLACVALAVTATSLSNPFILDDTSKIVDNPDIRHLADLPARLIYPYETTQVIERNDPSRPVVYLVYGIVHALFGVQPWAFRIVNLSLHAINVALVFLLICGLLGALEYEQDHRRTLIAAVLAALFFAVTPIQTGTAIYCYALSDVLSTTLVLSVLYLVVERDKPLLSYLIFGIALFTKQSAAVTPALVLLWDLARRCKFDPRALWQRWRLHAPFWAMSLLYLAWRVAYFGVVGDLEGRGHTPGVSTYAAFQPYAVIRYVLLTLVPKGLAIDHYIGPATVSPLLQWLATAVVAVGCLALIWYAIRLTTRRSGSSPTWRDLAFLGAAFYLVALGPTTSFFPTVDYLVERRTYLANIAIALGVCLLGIRLIRSVRPRFSLVLITAYYCLLVGVTLQRNYVHASVERTWRSVLAIYPDSIRALNNLGTQLSGEGHIDEAAACFNHILERDPTDVYAMSNLAGLYNKEGAAFFDRAKARRMFTHIIELKPTFVSAHYDLGRIDQIEGRLDEAEMRYKETLDLQPKHVPAHNNLGLLYLNENRLTEARSHLELAHRIDPDYAPAQHNLALLAEKERGHLSGSLGVEASPALSPHELRAPVPLADVEPSVLVPLFTRELAKNPKNLLLRRQYADYCWERKLPCAKEQYQELVGIDPSDATVTERLRALK